MTPSAPFCPHEALLALTGACNLSCAHCDSHGGRARLSRALAGRFLAGCKRAGITRVGFTGGEPFLAPGLLAGLAADAVRHGLLFGRIMTNGVWWRGVSGLRRTLERLARAGFDGTICVSVDDLHGQDIRKVAVFIREAMSIWRRGDIVSVAYVTGARDTDTTRRLRRLARLIGGRLTGTGTRRRSIRGRDFCVPLLPVGLSAVGRAARLKSGWDGAWFADDKCLGPGNVLFVLPDGSVKPCCGYATAHGRLTIGSIARHSPAELIRRARSNRFIDTIYRVGLGTIRVRLERKGWAFPGRTTDHCFFCDHLLSRVPASMLERSVSGAKS